MATTSPDNIYYPDTSTPWATTSDFSVQATSVQTALSNRQRYDFVWTNSGGRTGQTGMRQGDRGYQSDTHTEYIYDNSAWRPVAAYAEFTSASQTVNSTAFTAAGSISIVSGNSTSTTFATPSSNTITMTDPGIYMVHVFAVSSAAGGTGFVTTAIASDYPTNFNSQIGRGPFPSTDNVGQSVSYYRFAAAGGVFYFAYKQGDTASRTYTSTIRILRVG